jgi:hypothetical protein
VGGERGSEQAGGGVGGFLAAERPSRKQGAHLRVRRRADAQSAERHEEAADAARVRVPSEEGQVKVTEEHALEWAARYPPPWRSSASSVLCRAATSCKSAANENGGVEARP